MVGAFGFFLLFTFVPPARKFRRGSDSHAILRGWVCGKSFPHAHTVLWCTDSQLCVSRWRWWRHTRSPWGRARRKIISIPTSFFFGFLISSLLGLFPAREDTTFKFAVLHMADDGPSGLVLRTSVVPSTNTFRSHRDRNNYATTRHVGEREKQKKSNDELLHQNLLLG